MNQTSPQLATSQRSSSNSYAVPIDGKSVYCTIYGDTSLTRPALYCHGFCGSRLEAGAAHEAALNRGVSIISIDRPGTGKSDFVEKRSLYDWPKTVQGILNYFHIRDFELKCTSGGAPYSVVSALHFGARVRSLTIVSGMGDMAYSEDCKSMPAFARTMLKATRTAPFLVRPIVNRLAKAWKKNPEKEVKILATKLSAVDRKILLQPLFFKFMRDNLEESLSAHPEVAFQELSILTSNWNVDTAKIKCPVTIIHGENDLLVPISMAQRTASRIPHAKFIRLADAGHFHPLEEPDVFFPDN